MKILLINLESDEERLRFQSSQFEQLGLSFERIPAISSSDIPDSLYANESSSWQRKLRKAELACFLSHKKAWEAVSDSEIPILILEDDVVLSKDLNRVLKNIEDRLFLDHVSLEARSRKKLLGKKQYRLCESYFLRKLFQDRSGAAAYVLWPSGAKKLLKKYSEKGASLADAHITECNTLTSYQVVPALAIQIDQCENYNLKSPIQIKSAISIHAKPTSDGELFLHIGFKIKRMSAMFKQGLKFIRYLGRSEYIKIELGSNFK